MLQQHLFPLAAHHPAGVNTKCALPPFAPLRPNLCPHPTQSPPALQDPTYWLGLAFGAALVLPLLNALRERGMRSESIVKRQDGVRALRPAPRGTPLCATTLPCGPRVS